jgi:hypothetical protein
MPCSLNVLPFEVGSQEDGLPSDLSSTRKSTIFECESVTLCRHPESLLPDSGSRRREPGSRIWPTAGVWPEPLGPDRWWR